ncbi:competence/damage-inducible protein A [Candidatus Chlorohelix sp.]|uniref:competence/damage-inducible protein A n=1 Tax=Candidatus Chlorohelix sp. TaxID=3139201 RepID=UPI003067C48E
MRAEILSIGTELLLGQIVDTNAQWLAGELSGHGIDLYFISQVGDNLGRLVETLRSAWNRSELIICTGGVGPTEDDLTREAISELLEEKMVIQEPVAIALQEYFSQRNIIMPEKNIKQAALIPSAQFLENPIGTAPGWWVSKDGHVIVAMPGVPHEMKQMWETQAVPRLKPLLPPGVILSRTLKILGKGESSVEEMVKDLINSNNPTMATYAKPDGVHLRITAKAADETTARDLIFEMEIKARTILGTFIYGDDAETIEGVVGTMLTDRNLTLGVMEVGTGGMVAAMLSEAPNSINFLRGGLVSQQRSMLAGWGVDSNMLEKYGIMSREVAEVMATAARRQTGAEAGLAICVSPGHGEFEGKPAGHIIMAVDLDGHLESSELNYRTKPSEVKRLASVFSLNLLRRALLK